MADAGSAGIRVPDETAWPFASITREPVHLSHEFQQLRNTIEQGFFSVIQVQDRYGHHTIDPQRLTNFYEANDLYMNGASSTGKVIQTLVPSHLDPARIQALRKEKAERYPLSFDDARGDEVFLPTEDPFTPSSREPSVYLKSDGSSAVTSGSPVESPLTLPSAQDSSPKSHEIHHIQPVTGSSPLSAPPVPWDSPVELPSPKGSSTKLSTPTHVPRKSFVQRAQAIGGLPRINTNVSLIQTQEGATHSAKPCLTYRMNNIGVGNRPQAKRFDSVDSSETSADTHTDPFMAPAAVSDWEKPINEDNWPQDLPSRSPETSAEPHPSNMVNEPRMIARHSTLHPSLAEMEYDSYRTSMLGFLEESDKQIPQPTLSELDIPTRVRNIKNAIETEARVRKLGEEGENEDAVESEEKAKKSGKLKEKMNLVRFMTSRKPSDDATNKSPEWAKGHLREFSVSSAAAPKPTTASARNKTGLFSRFKSTENLHDI
ncbi:MAG: hypothetical protein LQ340_007104 [Diploschistes diacapsis]|nr:MAG: hypothetical protein LQ340_007104 [Diploschistes diacapsis]